MEHSHSSGGCASSYSYKPNKQLYACYGGVGVGLSQHPLMKANNISEVKIV